MLSFREMFVCLLACYYKCTNYHTSNECALTEQTNFTILRYYMYGVGAFKCSWWGIIRSHQWSKMRQLPFTWHAHRSSWLTCRTHLMDYNKSIIGVLLFACHSSELCPNRKKVVAFETECACAWINTGLPKMQWWCILGCNIKWMMTLSFTLNGLRIQMLLDY